MAATFIQEFEGSEDDLIKPIDHTLADTQIGVGYGVTTLPHLRNLAVVGPFEVTGVSDHPTRRAIFTCRPTSSQEEVPCARRIVERLATQAYRGSVSPSDLDALMQFYEQGAKDGGFETGVRTALQAMLSSLHFVFRIEELPATAKLGTAYRISDLDLASRLSFFLWGTIPDAELIEIARRGGLSRPDMFDRQVRRMLTDARSDALGTRFAAQWLRLQDLHKVEPDALSFPYFDESLADAMARETELLFQHLVRDDRSALELLTAEYTFVNERLARHYGIGDVSGPEFPQGLVSRRQAARPARTWQRPDADVARQPDLAGAARQVGDGGAPRQPAAAATDRRAGSRGDEKRERRPLAVSGRTAGAAPRQPGVQLVSQRHRSDRALARQLRCHRRVAHQGSRGAGQRRE